VEAVLKGVEGMSFVYLQPVDVIRHRLVKNILEAYETFGESPEPDAV
jgi:phosphate starvation-inducible protein PhoH and related proteins